MSHGLKYDLRLTRKGRIVAKLLSSRSRVLNRIGFWWLARDFKKYDV